MNAVFSGRKVNIFFYAKFQNKKIFHRLSGKNTKKILSQMFGLLKYGINFAALKQIGNN